LEEKHSLRVLKNTVKVKKIETVLCAVVGRACHLCGLEADLCMVDSVICLKNKKAVLNIAALN
jgi:hypothetical protein